MIKKYVMIIAVLLVILMFTSTSTASFLSSKGTIYERLPENSPLKNILDRFSQVISNNNDIVSNDADEDDSEEEDDEYDDEYDDEIDPDDPNDAGLLPKIWDMVGEKTPYEGNYIDEGDDENITNTIDHPDDDDDGVVVDNGTVNPDKDVNTTNGLTIDEGEWTVKLERFVEIVMERNVKLGGMLQRVVEHTFAPGTTAESDGTAENDVVGVVVEGGSVGTPGEDLADVVVLTDNS